MTCWREEVFLFFPPLLNQLPVARQFPATNCSFRKTSGRRIDDCCVGSGSIRIHVAAPRYSSSAVQNSGGLNARQSEAVVDFWPRFLLVELAVLCCWLCFVFLALRSPWRINPTSEQSHVCDVTYLSHCIQYFLLLLQIHQNYDQWT